MYFIYILYSESANKYYVGHTDNLERRLFEHNNGMTRFTSNIASDWIIMYTCLLYTSTTDGKKSCKKRFPFHPKITTATWTSESLILFGLGFFQFRFGPC